MKDPKTRVCSQCEIRKPLNTNYFEKNIKPYSNFAYSCKKCRAIYYRAYFKRIYKNKTLREAWRKKSREAMARFLAKNK